MLTTSAPSAPVDFALRYNLALPGDAKAAQAIMQDGGFYLGILDGSFGPKSQNAANAYAEHFGLPVRQYFIGANGCNFTVFSDGPDLCARTVLATCFGSRADVASGQDNGITASGYDLKDHPSAMVVSLPMSYTPPCKGSPFGKRIKWGTPVQVQACGCEDVYAGSLQEVGPSNYTGNAVDLSEALAALVSVQPLSHFNPNAFKEHVNLRIPGGLRLRQS